MKNKNNYCKLWFQKMSGKNFNITVDLKLDADKKRLKGRDRLLLKYF